jgi:mannose-6-phosphate isomerase-like protein (cupin superfamily)
MFYVLEGVLTMRVGIEGQEITAGTFVCVPPGVTHTFSNTSEQPVRALPVPTARAESFRTRVRAGFVPMVQRR